MKWINEAIEAVTNLLSAPPAVIALVLIIGLIYGAWKINKMVITYIIEGETKYGEMKAIAVSYKALHEGISPEQAAREINQSIE